MDSFKGSLDAVAACAAVRDGIRRARPEWDVRCRPIADGGEGTAQTILDALGGEWRRRRVHGPLPNQRVTADFAWIPRRSLAVVETASAAGLTLVPPRRRNPELATSYGVGQLIRAAARLQPRRLMLGLGGSATVDGGVGMAMALGWRVLDARGRPLGLGGAALRKIHAIAGGPAIPLPRVEALCDVTNPLLGPSGAARVFGPQKGADAAMVRRLEEGLARLADVVRRDLGLSLADLSGGGAAGGLGAGAVAFLGARLRPGIETVLKTVRMNATVRGATWVITGEGCFDATSMKGKAVSGVAKAAVRAGARVVVFAGLIRLPRRVWKNAGIETAIPLAANPRETPACMRNAALRLRQVAERWAREVGEFSE